jgi:MinD superfamily P-loop ATPase
MKIVVASGKGGVGKTMLTSALALLFSKERKIVACDCDVDAPNLGLWLGITEYDIIEKISTSEKAFINRKKCVNCEKCAKVCPYGAIEIKNGKIEINHLLCEGCGVCQLVCPKGAIEIKPVKKGEIRINTTKYNFPLISGKLYPGESGSGKIVEELKRRAEEFNNEITIFDSAAGIGCPVIASVRGSDFAVLVTEPTPSAFLILKGF